MESKFKEGDLVTMVSGSRKMTVIEVKEDRKYVCSWSEKGKRKTDTFHEAELKLWESPLKGLGPAIFGDQWKG